MNPRRPDAVEGFLKEMELINDVMIQEARSVQRKKGGTIGRILIELGYLSEEEHALGMAAQLRMELVDLDEMEIPKTIISLIPKDLAETYKVIPVKLDNEAVLIAMGNPYDTDALSVLRRSLNIPVKAAVAFPQDLSDALKKYYQ